MTRRNAQSASKRRPATVITALALLGFLGLTALGGGIEMILFPAGNQYVPGEWLEGIPWIESWLVPGLVLGIGFGLGSLFVGFGLLRRPRWRWISAISGRTGHHWSWIGAIVLGAGLALWIVLEVLLIPERSVIEAVYAFVAVALIALALAPSTRTYLRHHA